MNESKNKAYGVSFLGWLALIFITLKLLNITVVATWSWWLVTLPLWGGFALFFSIIALIAIVAVVLSWLGK